MGFNLQLGDVLRSGSVTAIDDAIREIVRQEIARTPRSKFCESCAYMHQPEISARCCCVACHGDDVPAWAQRMNVTTPLSSEKTGDASPASEVKACPFCGGRARLISHESPEVTNYGYEVNCDECAAQGPSTDCEWDGNAEYAKRDAIAAWNRRAPLAAEKAEEPDAPGIVEAPDGTLPCVYCSNENLCVEIRKHPGMLGFSVRCGSATTFCGARGPVRPAQMDAVEEWNRAYRLCKLNLELLRSYRDEDGGA